MGPKEKKDEKGEPTPPVAAETEQPLVSPAPSVAPRPPVAKTPMLLVGLKGYYEVGEWAGREQLRCKHCPWDTLNGAEAMRAHLYSNHLAYDGQPREILLADKRGKAK